MDKNNAMVFLEKEQAIPNLGLTKQINFEYENTEKKKGNNRSPLMNDVRLKNGSRLFKVLRMNNSSCLMTLVISLFLPWLFNTHSTLILDVVRLRRLEGNALGEIIYLKEALTSK